MKHKYIRPEAFYESYQLSQHVAVCGWDVTFDVDGEESHCVANWDPNLSNSGPVDTITMFITNSARTCVWDASKPHHGYCYTNGESETDRLFNS